jgi:hypothetical protein
MTNVNFHFSLWIDLTKIPYRTLLQNLVFAHFRNGWCKGFLSENWPTLCISVKGTNITVPAMLVIKS